MQTTRLKRESVLSDSQFARHKLANLSGVRKLLIKVPLIYCHELCKQRRPHQTSAFSPPCPHAVEQRF